MLPVVWWSLGILAVLFFVFYWDIMRKYRRVKAMILARPTTDDEAFIAAVPIKPENDAERNFLRTVRTLIAQYGGVPPESIRPDDTMEGSLLANLLCWSSDGLDLAMLYIDLQKQTQTKFEPDIFWKVIKDRTGKTRREYQVFLENWTVAQLAADLLVTERASRTDTDST